MFASADLDSLGKAMADAPIPHAMFFASLVIFEIRFFKYWVGGTLGQILLESGAIGIVGFLSGRSALSEVMRRRGGKS
jgi:oligosaccharyltransferase complex subunit delta (ribophorin II)